MPEAPPVVESTSTPVDEPKEFGTKIEDIWDKTAPLDDDLIETGEPEEVETEQPEKKVEKTPVKEVEPEKKRLEVPDDLFKEVPEPQKAEEKVEEPKETPIPDNIKSEKARTSFKELDQRRIAAEKRALEVEKRAKLAEEKASLGDPDAKARIQQLEQHIQGMDALVQRAALQEHPEFQKRYTIPRQQWLEQAKKAFTDAGGDPSQIDSALQLTGKARVDKLDDLLGEVSSKLLSGKLEQSIAAIDRIDSEATSVLKNSAEYNRRLAQNDQVSRHKMFEELEKSTKQNLESASKVLADDFKIALFRKSSDPKFTEWNDTVDKINQAAENIMLKTESPKEMAIAAKMAAAFPVSWNLLNAKHKENAQLKKKLSEYESSEPGLGGAQAPRASRTEQEDDDVPLATAIISSIKNAQGR